MITANTKELQRAVKIAMLTVDKSKEPYILLDVASSVLTVSCFDGVVLSKTRVKVEGTDTWSVAVQSELLAASQFSFDEEDTEIKYSNNKLLFTCGNSKASLPEYAGSPIPNTKFPENGVILPVLEAKRLANLHIFCGDEDSGQNKYKHGVYVSLESGLAMVTDMMSAARLGLSALGQGYAIVPRRVMLMLSKLIDTDVEMTIGKNKVYFKVGDTDISSPTINATDWPAAAFDKFFNTQYTSRVTLNRGELFDILQACVKFNKFSPQNVAILETNSGNLRIKSFPSEMGELDRDIDSVVEGEFKVGVRPEALLSGLEKIKAETITLEVLPTSLRFISEEFGYICMLRNI